MMTHEAPKLSFIKKEKVYFLRCIFVLFSITILYIKLCGVSSLFKVSLIIFAVRYRMF